jgi:hypothetical protein
MKVKELIKLLSQEDPDMRVVVAGYESGCDELDKIYQIQIVPNPSSGIKTWEGEFDQADSRVPSPGTETALYLPRKS